MKYLKENVIAKMLMIVFVIGGFGMIISGFLQLDFLSTEANSTTVKVQEVELVKNIGGDLEVTLDANATVFVIEGGEIACGNVVVESVETCDDVITVGGDGCSATCQSEVVDPPDPAVCGNSTVETGEQCDDGNTTSGDGCSGSCQTETTKPTTNAMTNLSDRGTLDSRGLKAFPGAEGAGQYSIGGRGGTIFSVNDYGCSTVAGDGKRTISEGMQRKGDAAGIGAITIVSEIGGLFPCIDVLSIPAEGITKSDINPSFWSVQSETTLACQSAPSPGMHIALWRMEIKGKSNIIIRGCNFYGIDISGDNAALLRVVGTGNSNDLIFDRNAYRHNVDDLAVGYIGKDVQGTIKNLSFTNNIVTEADAYSTHPEANPGANRPGNYTHAMGVGCSSSRTGGNLNPVVNCSLIGNMIAHAERRCPKIWDASGHIIGNFMYNCGTAGISLARVVLTTGNNTGPRAKNMDVYVQDNIQYYGPNSRMRGIEADGFRQTVPAENAFQIQATNNRYVAMGTSTPTAYPERTGSPVASRSMPLSEAIFHPTRDWLSGIADESAFDCVGPKKSDRDADMNRIISEIKTRTGEIGIGPVYGNPKQADGDHGRPWLPAEGGNLNYFGSSSHSANYDTDNDGMGDAWEAANGLNVGTKDHNDDLDGDGYTNIEEFVNSLIRC